MCYHDRTFTMANTDFHQLWGTFSVRDHLRKGAYLSEVLLYDRLVIPVPPKNDPAEWDRWNSTSNEVGEKKESWDPQRQSKILDCLEGLVERVEWSAQDKEQWKLNWDKSRQGVAQQVARELGNHWTAKGLLNQVPTYAKGVVASSSHSTLAEVEKELGIQRTRPGQKLDGNVISVIIGRQFFVPKNPKYDELDLLRAAADLARDKGFQMKRAAYNQWQQTFLDSEGLVDGESLKKALEEMNDQLTDHRRLVDDKKLWNGVRRAFLFVQVALPIAVAATVVPTGVPLAIGMGSLAVGAYTVSEKLSSLNKKHELPGGAVLFEAQRKLDLTRAAAG